MAKQIAQYRCADCLYQTSKWMGQCAGCQAWNTLASYMPQARTERHAASSNVQLRPLCDQSTPQAPVARMVTGLKEWDRVVGGGILPGAFIMLTGDPGIGKSTLLLQISHLLAERYTLLYFSSEESREQVRSRAERLGCVSPALLFSDQATVPDIVAALDAHAPQVIIVDSLQNCSSVDDSVAYGSVAHLRNTAFQLMRIAKDRSIAVLLSGHITKDGTLAGPKLLEHMVDAVFYLQGEDRWQMRILRSVKNRFGAIDEIGFFEMHEQGLVEVPNFNEQVLADAAVAPGAMLTSSLEGTRPLLVELQALTIPTHFTMPQRIVSGIDQKQVTLIAAILEKHLKIKFSTQDIFLKVGGGIKLKGNGADLSIALALLSSYFQQALPPRWLALGEVSLTGHIKPVSQMGPHVSEARKFGIDKICLAVHQRVDCPRELLRTFSTVYDLLALFTID